MGSKDTEQWGSCLYRKAQTGLLVYKDSWLIKIYLVTRGECISGVFRMRQAFTCLHGGTQTEKRCQTSHLGVKLSNSRTHQFTQCVTHKSRNTQLHTDTCTRPLNTILTDSCTYIHWGVWIALNDKKKETVCQKGQPTAMCKNSCVLLCVHTCYSWFGDFNLFL